LHSASFCVAEEGAYLIDILRLIKIALPVIKEHEFVSTIPMNAAAVKVQQPKPTPRVRFTTQKSRYNRSSAKL
jgi:hypothetical protein